MVFQFGASRTNFGTLIMMMKKLWVSLIILNVVVFALSSCKKDTVDIIPEVITVDISLITPVSASCNGLVTLTGNSEIAEKGVCWSELQLPSVSDNKYAEYPHSSSKSFTGTLTGLISNTTYFVRAYAISSTGTAYGNELSFKTPEDHSGETGIVYDADGNQYKTIGIGSQIWMAENLKTTRYNDGTEVPLANCARIWTAIFSPGYCWFNNEELKYKETYGALYNWYTVNTGKLCPSGWHVPGFSEWTTMESFLGGSNLAGGKLKEEGNVNWRDPNTGATNESGFTALPAGYRGDQGFFLNVGESIFFWTSSWATKDNAYIRTLTNTSGEINSGEMNVTYGAYIRCIKD